MQASCRPNGSVLFSNKVDVVHRRRSEKSEKVRTKPEIGIVGDIGRKGTIRKITTANLEQKL